MPYVTDIEQSKSKPLAQAQSLSELTLLILVAAIPLMFYPSDIIFTLVMVLLFFRYLFKHWLIDRLGGFTGDCLGAAQQISELLIYLTLVAYIDNDALLAATLAGSIT